MGGKYTPMAELEHERGMIDAIRAMMGLQPLYADDPVATDRERFAPLATYPDPPGLDE